MSVKNRPIWMQSKWIKLIEVHHVLLLPCIRLICCSGRNLCQCNQFSESCISLFSAFLIWVRIRKRSKYLVVEVLVQAVQILLNEVEFTAPKLKFKELVMLFVLLDACLRTGALHREVEHQDGHLEHILTLLGHRFARENLAWAYILFTCITLCRIQRVRILSVI